MGNYTSDLLFTIGQDGLAGTDKWTEYRQQPTGSFPNCTANWTINGLRQ